MPLNPFNFFTSQGWSPAQAAGIVGNLQYESGFNPHQFGDSGSAYGIGQWHPDRQAIFARVMGRPIMGSSMDQQLQFVQYELTHNEARAGTALRGQTSVSGATSTMMNLFERPSANARAGSIGARTSLATRAIGTAGHTEQDMSNYVRNQENAMFPFLGDISSWLGGGAPLGAGGSGTLENMGAAVNDPVGAITGGGSAILQGFQDWISNSGFFQRLALALFALILLAGFVYMLKSNDFDLGKTVTT